MTTPKIGLCIAPFMGLELGRVGEFARMIEDAGLDGIFIPEGRNDGLIACYAAATATRRITVASWITNIFLRDPALCAWAARDIDEAAAGRFILGLGVSHRPLLEHLGITIAQPRMRLADYVRELRSLLDDQARAAAVPIYFAALALETVRLGAEVADGLMLDICTVGRLRTASATAWATLERNGRSRKQFTITTGVPLFLDSDRSRALAAAQRTLARYAALPAYNRMFSRSGFTDAMAELRAAPATADAAALISPAMAEGVALIGPPEEWPARLEALAAAGAAWIILRPFPIAEDYAAALHAAIKTLARLR